MFGVWNEMINSVVENLIIIVVIFRRNILKIKLRKSFNNVVLKKGVNINMKIKI